MQTDAVKFKRECITKGECITYSTTDFTSTVIYTVDHKTQLCNKQSLPKLVICCTCILQSAKTGTNKNSSNNLAKIHSS